MPRTRSRPLRAATSAGRKLTIHNHSVETVAVGVGCLALLWLFGYGLPRLLGSPFLEWTTAALLSIPLTALATWRRTVTFDLDRQGVTLRRCLFGLANTRRFEWHAFERIEFRRTSTTQPEAFQKTHGRIATSYQVYLVGEKELMVDHSSSREQARVIGEHLAEFTGYELVDAEPFRP